MGAGLSLLKLIRRSNGNRMSNRQEIRRLAEEIDKLKKGAANLAGGYKSDYVTKSRVKELLKEIRALDKEDSYRVLKVNKDGTWKESAPAPYRLTRSQVVSRRLLK